MVQLGGGSGFSSGLLYPKAEEPWIRPIYRAFSPSGKVFQHFNTNSCISYYPKHFWTVFFFSYLYLLNLSLQRVKNNDKSLKHLVRKLKVNVDVDHENFIVVGVDFVTTWAPFPLQNCRSLLAYPPGSLRVVWNTAGDVADKWVNLITTWPGHGPEEGKTPTEI